MKIRERVNYMGIRTTTLSDMGSKHDADLAQRGIRYIVDSSEHRIVWQNLRYGLDRRETLQFLKEQGWRVRWLPTILESIFLIIFGPNDWNYHLSHPQLKGVDLILKTQGTEAWHPEKKLDIIREFYFELDERTTSKSYGVNLI